MKSFMNWSCVVSAVVDPSVGVVPLVGGLVAGVEPTLETGVVMAFLSCSCSCSCDDPHVGACGLLVGGREARVVRRRAFVFAARSALLRRLAAHRLGAEVGELETLLLQRAAELVGAGA